MVCQKHGSQRPLRKASTMPQNDDKVFSNGNSGLLMELADILQKAGKEVDLSIF